MYTSNEAVVSRNAVRRRYTRARVHIKHTNSLSILQLQLQLHVRTRRGL
jgi:hypothetical protein